MARRCGAERTVPPLDRPGPTAGAPLPSMRGGSTLACVPFITLRAAPTSLRKRCVAAHARPQHAHRAGALSLGRFWAAQWPASGIWRLPAPAVRSPPSAPQRRAGFAARYAPLLTRKPPTRQLHRLSTSCLDSSTTRLLTRGQRAGQALLWLGAQARPRCCGPASRVRGIASAAAAQLQRRELCSGGTHAAEAPLRLAMQHATIMASFCARSLLLALLLSGLTCLEATGVAISGAFTAQQIQSVGSGLCMTVDGQALVMSTCAALPSQLFSFGTSAFGGMAITQTSNSEMMVGVSGGSAITGTAAAACSSCGGQPGRVVIGPPGCASLFSAVTGGVFSYSIYSGSLATGGYCCYYGSCTSNTACLSATGSGIDGFSASLTLAACNSSSNTQQWVTAAPPAPPSPPLPPPSPPSPPAPMYATTLAGTCHEVLYSTPPLADGTGSLAAFHMPSGIAINPSGILTVVEISGDVRKVTAAGGVTTLAVQFVNGAAYFQYPYAVAVDAYGNMYASDPVVNCIYNISASGQVRTLAGNNATTYAASTNGLGLSGLVNGAGTSALFNSPEGIAVNSLGEVYVADFKNKVIRKISVGGYVSTFAGGGAWSTGPPPDGSGTSAAFAAPFGIALDSSGNLFVSDLSLQYGSVRKVTPAGVVSTLATNLANPSAIAVDATGNVWVFEGNVLTKISAQGAVTHAIAGQVTGGYADGVGTNAMFYSPLGLAVDASGSLFVADTYSNCIRKVSTTAPALSPPSPPPSPPSSTLSPPPSPQPPQPPPPPAWPARYTCADVTDLLPAQCAAMAAIVRALPGLASGAYTSINSDLPSYTVGSTTYTSYNDGVPWFSSTLACGPSVPDRIDGSWTGIVGCWGSSGEWTVTRLRISSQNTGVFPAAVFSLSTLRELQIYSNRGMTGFVPDLFASLPALTWLDLGGNTALSGAIPQSIGSLPGLTQLYLASKRSRVSTTFTGVVPASLCSLSFDNSSVCSLPSTVTCPLPSCATVAACSSGCVSASPPPPSSGWSTVAASVTLGGYTATTFASAQQTAFIAVTAGVLNKPTSSLVITSISTLSNRRRDLLTASVQVALSVTATSASDATAAGTSLSSLATSQAAVFVAALQAGGLASATSVAITVQLPPSPPPQPPSPSPPPSPPWTSYQTPSQTYSSNYPYATVPASSPSGKSSSGTVGGGVTGGILLAVFLGLMILRWRRRMTSGITVTSVQPPQQPVMMQVQPAAGMQQLYAAPQQVAYVAAPAPPPESMQMNPMMVPAPVPPLQPLPPAQKPPAPAAHHEEPPAPAARHHDEPPPTQDFAQS